MLCFGALHCTIVCICLNETVIIYLLMWIVSAYFCGSQGTTYVYETFFKPLVAKHETEIDRNLLELRLRAGDMMVFGWQKAASYGQTRFLEILHYVASQSQVSRTRSVQVLFE